MKPRRLRRARFIPRYVFNLLDQGLYLRMSKRPELLSELVAQTKPGDWVLIDEIQKIPALLDQVHLLMEEKKLNFALSGSSARKLRRQGANLLAGRAVTRQLLQFCFAEISAQFNLQHVLSHGLMPIAFLNHSEATDFLQSYVETYIKEEIKEEGAVRKIDPFLRFLEVAGILNGMQVNSSNISREASISRGSVDGYFSILIDTLVGHLLPAYVPRICVQEQSHPKFYWFDPGVARSAAGLLHDHLETEWLGRALETYIFHEIRSYNTCAERYRPIFYYRTKAGAEIDFVIETSKGTLSKSAEVVLIEVKYSSKWNSRAEEPMRSFSECKKVKVKKMIGIYCGSETLQRGNIVVYPVVKFLALLHANKIF